MTLEGTLQDMALNDLFEVFHLGNKSGILQLFSSSQSASVYVTMGRVIDAVLAQWPNRGVIAVGDEAILHLLQWVEAEFVFTPDNSVMYHPVTVFHDITQLQELVPLQAAQPEAVLQVALGQSIPLDTFAQDLSLTRAVGQRVDGRYRKLSLETAQGVLPVKWEAARPLLDLAPLPEYGQRSAPVAPTRVSAPAPAPVPAPQRQQPAAYSAAIDRAAATVQVRTAAPQPTRRLMQAVLRRVRSL